MIPGIGIGGGAERSLLDLAPGLREQGIDLTVMYFHERPSSAEAAFRAASIPLLKVEGARHWPGRVRAVRAAIREQAPDVLHTTLYEADVVGRLAAIGLPPTVLTSMVSTPYAAARRLDPAYSGWRMAITRRIDAATLRLRGDHVHANSAAVGRAAQVALGVDPARVTVVPRGRRADDFPPGSPERRGEVRAALGLAPEAPVLIVVGRQEGTKGHLTLIEALPAVVAAHPDLQVLLAGRDGAVTAEIAEAIARHGLAARIHQLGYRSDVADLLAAADAFVFPSVLEGLPGAVIEAMAVGVPIVAAGIDPVRELVDERSALLVEPGDADDLGAAILEVLDDRPAAIERAARARARFEDAFTLDRSLDAMVSLYRSVASA